MVSLFPNSEPLTIYYKLSIVYIIYIYIIGIYLYYKLSIHFLYIYKIGIIIQSLLWILNEQCIVQEVRSPNWKYWLDWFLLGAQREICFTFYLLAPDGSLMQSLAFFALHWHNSNLCPCHHKGVFLCISASLLFL